MLLQRRNSQNRKRNPATLRHIKEAPGLMHRVTQCTFWTSARGLTLEIWTTNFAAFSVYDRSGSEKEWHLFFDSSFSLSFPGILHFCKLFLNWRLLKWNFFTFLFCEVCIVYTVYSIWHDTKVRDETKNEQGLVFLKRSLQLSCDQQPLSLCNLITSQATTLQWS